MDREEKARLAAEPPAWMYAWDLGDGVRTPLLDAELESIHATRERMIFSQLDRLYPDGLTGASCLDVACNEGYFSQLLWRRGASVTGIDIRPLNVRRARAVQAALGIGEDRLRFTAGDFLNFEAPDAAYEATLFLGILYHLENPMGALRRLHALTRRVVVVETQLTRQEAPVRSGWGQTGVTLDHDASLAIHQEREGDSENLAAYKVLSFIPNRAAVRLMLLVAGFAEVVEIEPFADANPQYLDGDRAIFLGFK